MKVLALFIAVCAWSGDDAYAQGTPDQTFGVYGSVLLSPKGPTFGMAIGVDGKITIGHAQENIGYPGLAITRLLSTGAPDTLFGNQGDSYPGVRTFDLSFAGVIPQIIDRGSFITAPDRGYYLAASVQLAGRSGSAILKIHPDGTLDEGFGNKGIVIEDPGVTSMAIGDDNRLLVAGRSRSPFAPPFVFRLLPDGERDSTFADGGSVLLDATNSTGYALDTPQLLIAPDGSYLVVADAVNLIPDHRRAVLLRLGQEGVRDTSFANGRGVAVTDVYRELYNYGKSAAILPDGKIITVGGGGTNCVIQRWNSDGTKDAMFGTDGAVTLSVDVPLFHGTMSSTNCFDVGGWHDDRLYVLGAEYEVDGNVNLTTNFVAALNSTTGSLDLNYGRDGIGLPVYDSTSIGRISAIDHLNRVVFVGSGASRRLYLARLTSDLIFSDGFDVRVIEQAPTAQARPSK